MYIHIFCLMKSELLKGVESPCKRLHGCAEFGGRLLSPGTSSRRRRRPRFATTPVYYDPLCPVHNNNNNNNINVNTTIIIKFNDNNNNT